MYGVSAASFLRWSLCLIAAKLTHFMTALITSQLALSAAMVETNKTRH